MGYQTYCAVKGSIRLLFIVVFAVYYCVSIYLGCSLISIKSFVRLETQNL